MLSDEHQERHNLAWGPPQHLELGFERMFATVADVLDVTPVLSEFKHLPRSQSSSVCLNTFLMLLTSHYPPILAILLLC